MDSLTALVTLVLALSLASERLVEIVKGFWPWLHKEMPDDPAAEGKRRATVQILAVAAGLGTAAMAMGSLPFKELGLPIPDGNGPTFWYVLGLGLLASGGSAFWNSILDYVGKVNALKKLAVADTKMDVAAKKAASASAPPTKP